MRALTLLLARALPLLAGPLAGPKPFPAGEFELFHTTIQCCFAPLLLFLFRILVSSGRNFASLLLIGLGRSCEIYQSKQKFQKCSVLGVFNGNFFPA
jgi:hypothetical protein